MFLGRAGEIDPRRTDVPVAICCTEQKLSGEHLDQALHLHPCLTLLLFPLPSPCSQQLIPALTRIPKCVPPQFTATLSSRASRAPGTCLGLPTVHVQSEGREMQLQGPCGAFPPV